MSRFNQVATTETTNRAGGHAYSMSKEAHLALLLLTSFLQDKDNAYRNAKDTEEEIAKLIGEVDPKFGAKSCLYARNEIGMRTITHVGSYSVYQAGKGQPWLKNYFTKIARRPDDMLEIASYFKSKGLKMLPKAVQKGFAKRLRKYDDYRLAKYKASNKDMSLVDLVNMCHPKPTPSLVKLMTGKLKNERTWEAKVSQAGKSKDKKKAKEKAWSEMIDSGDIGYFALLRNLRNIATDCPDKIDNVCEMLTNREAIKKSLVLPFRFLSAAEAIQDNRQLFMAVSEACDISCDNVPDFPGKTLVAIDVSGSMMGRPIQIATLFGAVLYKAISGSEVMTFDTSARYINLNPMDSIFSLRSGILNRRWGGGTSFNSIFATANNRYDRIIILSDMQGWVDPTGWTPGPWRSSHDNVKIGSTYYKKKFKCNPKIYSFDVTGLGTLKFPEKNTYLIGGWSEKVFDLMRYVEEDPNALTKVIESYVEL